MSRRFSWLLLLTMAAASALLGQIEILSTSPLPIGYVGIAYNYTFNAQVQAGLPQATWSVQPAPAPALPPGLTLSPNGTLAGTPTAASQTLPYTFTVVAQTGNFTTSMQFSMTVSVPAISINTTSLPSGVIGQPYSVTLAGSSAPAGITWIAGTGLPPGLSISPNGILSGAPTNIGTYGVEVIAVISGTKISTSTTFPLTVYSGQLIIQNTFLPTAQTGKPYSATLSSNPAGATWSEMGTLPVGIVFNSSTGVLSGTTSSVGIFPLQITATEANYASQTVTLTLDVTSGPLTIASTNLSPAVVGSAYTATAVGAGGIPPYQWAFLNSANNGLSINSGTGAITGTPTASGSFLLGISLTDATGTTVTSALNLFVATPLQVASTSLPNASIGVAYSQILMAGGGTSPYSWLIVAGSGSLPNGLALSTAGTISGTPTSNGTSTFTLQVTDSGGRTATRTLSLSVSSSALTITTSSLPNGQLSVAYSQTLTATGGAPPYTWTLASGALPAGLSVSPAGVISGAPSGALGTTTFTVQVADSTGTVVQKAFTINVALTLSITTLSLPSATKGVAYPSTQILASGGTPSYTWSITTGSLPPGLSLAPSSGAITGTPTATGSTVFTVQVTDSVGQTATAQFTLAVNAPGSPLSVTTSGAVSAVVGTSFSEALTATGGTPPYTWSASGLPAGLQINGSSIAGAPATSAAGTANVTITVTDSAGLTATGSITLTVTLPAPPSITFGAISAVPATQVTPTLTLSNTYPLALSGALSVSFTSAVGGSPTEVGFVTSGGGLVTSVPFTVAANSTAVVFPNSPALVTGTVEGTITLTVALAAGGNNITPTPAPSETIQIPATPPVIETVTLASSTGSVTVTVIGYSPTRDMVSGQFQFYTSSGPILAPVTVQLGSAFSTWYGNSASNAHGSQFSLTIPFSVTGKASDITAVNATLTNSKGVSNSLETVPSN